MSTLGIVKKHFKLQWHNMIVSVDKSTLSEVYMYIGLLNRHL